MIDAFCALANKNTILNKGQNGNSRLRQRWRLLVENRAGANGIIGSDLVAKILADPVVSEREVALGADPSGMKSEEFNQFVVSYGSRMAQLIKEAGMNPSEQGG